MFGRKAVEQQPALAEQDGDKLHLIRKNIRYKSSPGPLARAMEKTYTDSVLMALPTLPKELEFRFVGRDLILRDTHANLIVDFLPNVF